MPQKWTNFTYGINVKIQVKELKESGVIYNIGTMRSAELC